MLNLACKSVIVLMMIFYIQKPRLKIILMMFLSLDFQQTVWILAL